MNVSSLELALLTYWQSNGVKAIYKYKHRIKEYKEQENRVNIELFTDVTSGTLFKDVGDIANSVGTTDSDAMVDIETLLAARH